MSLAILPHQRIMLTPEQLSRQEELLRRLMSLRVLPFGTILAMANVHSSNSISPTLSASPTKRVTLCKPATSKCGIWYVLCLIIRLSGRRRLARTFNECGQHCRRRRWRNVHRRRLSLTNNPAGRHVCQPGVLAHSQSAGSDHNAVQILRLQERMRGQYLRRLR